MNSRACAASLVVFAKEPVPGHVKTRMTPALTPAIAAAFYREMLADVLDESARACLEHSTAGVLTVSPAIAMRRMASMAPAIFAVVAQSGNDLGARMAHEVRRAMATGASRVVLRGSDNPALGSDQLSALFSALDSFDVVASPDPDGGYGAIGLRVTPGNIFDHAMSTRDVLRDTLERARTRGLSTHTTAESFDLDTVDDVARLLVLRDSLPVNRCPRTLAFADAHDLWPKLDATGL